MYAQYKNYVFTLFCLSQKTPCFNLKEVMIVATNLIIYSPKSYIHRWTLINSHGSKKLHLQEIPLIFTWVWNTWWTHM